MAESGLIVLGIALGSLIGIQLLRKVMEVVEFLIDKLLKLAIGGVIVSIIYIVTTTLIS